MHIRPVNVLALVLPLIAGAVWAPQLLNSDSEPRFSADDELPAEYRGSSNMASEDAAAGETSTAASERVPVNDFESDDGGAVRIVLRPEARSDQATDAAQPPPPLEPFADAAPEHDRDSDEGPPPNPLLASLESTLGELKQMNSRRRDLSELLDGGWGAPSETKAAPGVAPAEPQAPFEPNVEAALAEWVGERRLTGVVYGPELALAVFDDQIISRGTRFDGGIAVADVGPEWVEIELRGHRRRIELAAFRPVRSMSFGGGDDAADAEDEADGTPPAGAGPRSRDLLQAPVGGLAGVSLTQAVQAVANPTNTALSGKVDQ